MQAWFGNHYEDPANRVSYNSREGGYLWVPGLGPHDADNEIQEEFSDVADFGLMAKAVEDVQSDGILDWASKNYFREIDDEALRDREEEDRGGFPFILPMPLGSRPSAGTAPTFSDAVGGGPTAGGPYPPRSIVSPGIFGEDEPPRDEAPVRKEMLERLDHLERLIAPLTTNIGMMGHNGPPGPIEDPEIPEHQPSLTEPPLTVRDLSAIRTAIGDIREQAQAASPDVEVVERGQGVLSRAAKHFGRWLMLAADEAVQTAGKTAGALLVAGAIMGWQNVGPALESATSSVATWIQTIEVPW